MGQNSYKLSVKQLENYPQSARKARSPTFARIRKKGGCRGSRNDRVIFMKG